MEIAINKTGTNERAGIEVAISNVASIKNTVIKSYIFKADKIFFVLTAFSRVKTVY